MKPLFYSIVIFNLLYLLSACAAAVVGGAAVGTSVAIDQRTTSGMFEDQGIKNKFTELYFADTELNARTHINFTSYNNQALITGEAPNEQDKQTLSNIVDKISNIRRYFNEVQIAPASSIMVRSNDSYITTVVKTNIFNSVKALDGGQAKVVTENSSVFLMGIVTQKQADQITEIARTTNGVKRVVKLFEYINTDQ